MNSRALQTGISRKNQIWLITFVLWLVGASFIYILWNFHISNDILDTLWGFLLYLVAFFYPLTLHPIHNAVYRAMPTEFVELGPYELEIVYRSGWWEGSLFRSNHLYPKLNNPRLMAVSREELIENAWKVIEQDTKHHWVSAYVAEQRDRQSRR
jgi:hypothetical protein